MMFKVLFIGTFVNSLSMSDDASSFGCFTVFSISMNSLVDSIIRLFCINGAINAFRRLATFCVILSPLVILLVI